VTDQSKNPGAELLERERYLWFWILVGGALVLVALIWLFGVLFPPATGFRTPSGLEARGNAIGALFGGLAFVGVVAAIFLQWKELGYQRQELRETKVAMQESAKAQHKQTEELQAQTEQLSRQVFAQEMEFDKNDRSRQRESRVHFMTARLNASLALLNACQARLSSLGNSGSDSEEGNEQSRQIRKLTQEIAILRCMANGGFDWTYWDWAEMMAIRRYLIEMFRDTYNRYSTGHEEIGMKLKTAGPKALYIKEELALLGEKYRERFPQIADAIEKTVAGTPPYQTQVKIDDQLEAILGWLQKPLLTFLDVSNPMWPQRETQMIREVAEAKRRRSTRQATPVQPSKDTHARPESFSREVDAQPTELKQADTPRDSTSSTATGRALE
jgi:uncharacterized protein Smg (DUF494 family)